ncbi:MOSC domain-containing protein [Paenibacillus sp. y28]|uniref:MOSC domain-containing protein n=1 Tax=Paenibacillus sp. y28 TaxID=3129110 RepID=UPI003017E174
MSLAEVVSLNIGKPEQVPFQNKDIPTGINKKPAAKPLFLSWVNFEGDGQADLVHHGGRDKAVCVYAYEHYPFWEKELGRTLEYGAFGENLTIRGLLEADVCIGDIFQLGDAVVQVSQPRQPCFKLSVKYGVPDLPVKVQETGYTGFYFRVLQEGTVSASSSLKRLTPHPQGITVSYANQIMHHEKQNEAGIRSILAVDALSASWQAAFLKRLQGIETDTRERLNGFG